MARDAKIYLRRDGASVSEPLLPQEASLYPNDFLILDVYANEPKKRQSSIPVWIDATILAPQHIYRHELDGSVFYEVTHEFIHRVGVQPGTTVPFDSDFHIHRSPKLKAFDYAVVGDCTTLDGLSAPYDEENTAHILKIERVPVNKSLVDFWFEQANTDLFSGKQPEMQKFNTP